MWLIVATSYMRVTLRTMFYRTWCIMCQQYSKTEQWTRKLQTR
jgi:hypothetical protein